jgi:RNA polymerase sigma-70 factor, ECF subfamily
MVESGTASDQPSRDPEDAQLMARVSQGDVASFDVIVSRYWKPTFIYALHLAGDREKAADVAQEAFTRLWERRDSWRASGSVGGWLFRTARNLVISDRRKWRLHMRWSTSTTREEARRPRTPLQDTEATEVRVALQEAIETLPPRRREVFVLFHLQDLSHREIGEILGIRPQTVANHLHDAALEMRGLMKRFLPGSMGPQDAHGGRTSTTSD